MRHSTYWGLKTYTLSLNQLRVAKPEILGESTALFRKLTSEHPAAPKERLGRLRNGGRSMNRSLTIETKENSYEVQTVSDNKLESA